ncbi:hypothetical protein GH714_029924 [Hevea brasiliensis]|uniref:Uncharacterized protein n=1 Tax=Hevea brasiliensis TaxID=3981 RepID=A0A6A6KP55_HEVBR|nr:hypothetical protein GH714_029924 [Hevea brasiliensis]
MVGCLGNLYESINRLGVSYMITSQIKESILKRTGSIYTIEVPIFLPSNDLPLKQYRCQNCLQNTAKEPNTYCTSCSRSIGGRNYVPPKETGFVKGVVTYMVMENLEASPMSSISSITLLNKIEIQDLSVLEERMVVLGMDEAWELLKESCRLRTFLQESFLEPWRIEDDTYAS